MVSYLNNSASCLPHLVNSTNAIPINISRSTIFVYLLRMVKYYFLFLAVCYYLCLWCLNNHVLIVIIIPGQFINRPKWWFGLPHQGRFDILTMMGRDCSRLDPSYQRHIAFACTFCYQLHPHHRLGNITTALSPVPIYRPREDG